MIDIEEREGHKISPYPGAVEWLLDNGLAHVSRGTNEYILSAYNQTEAQEIGRFNAKQALLRQHKKELIRMGIRKFYTNNKMEWLGH